eukprot:GHVS01031281.1.p1 GENE.GHVS01031281.1~~GHVS01031281.1.p1  ORF type:complete len:387 (-),score=133.81 GHVS01031281.1:173-1267(-)
MPPYVPPLLPYSILLLSVVFILSSSSYAFSFCPSTSSFGICRNAQDTSHLDRHALSSLSSLSPLSSLSSHSPLSSLSSSSSSSLSPLSSLSYRSSLPHSPPSFLPPPSAPSSLLPLCRPNRYRHGQHRRQSNSSSLSSSSSLLPSTVVPQTIQPTVTSPSPSTHRPSSSLSSPLRPSSLSSLFAEALRSPLSRVIFFHPPLLLQIVLAISFYFLHMLVLSKHSLPLPFELIPNPWNMFTAVGLDTVAGVVAAVALYLPNTNNNTNNTNRTPITTATTAMVTAAIVTTTAATRARTSSQLSEQFACSSFAYQTEFHRLTTTFVYLKGICLCLCIIVSVVLFYVCCCCVHGMYVYQLMYKMFVIHI